MVPSSPHLLQLAELQHGLCVLIPLIKSMSLGPRLLRVLYLEPYSSFWSDPDNFSRCMAEGKPDRELDSASSNVGRHGVSLPAELCCLWRPHCCAFCACRLSFDYMLCFGRARLFLDHNSDLGGRRGRAWLLFNRLREVDASAIEW